MPLTIFHRHLIHWRRAIFVTRMEEILIEAVSREKPRKQQQKKRRKRLRVILRSNSFQVLEVSSVVCVDDNNLQELSCVKTDRHHTLTSMPRSHRQIATQRLHRIGTGKSHMRRFGIVLYIHIAGVV